MRPLEYSDCSSPYIKPVDGISRTVHDMHIHLVAIIATYL